MFLSQAKPTSSSPASKSTSQPNNTLQLHGGQKALLQLQQKIGNRAMTHFLTSQVQTAEAPIQRMMNPVDEQSDLKTAYELVKKEFERQIAINKEIPNRKEIEPLIGKIKIETDDPSLIVHRLNTCITKLNLNITRRVVPDVAKEEEKASASNSNSGVDDYPIVPRDKIRAHPYFDRTSLLGLLQDSQIEFWTERRAPIPKNLAEGRIAEYLSKEKLEEEHASASAPVKVLNGLKISTPQENAEHPFRDIAEIDNLVVVKGDHGYIPKELIETKAGSSGKQKGALQSQLSMKIKALQDVAEESYYIFLNGKDITNQFDMSAIASTKVTGRDSGIYKTNDIRLNEADIHGIFDFLQLHQRWMVNGGEGGDLHRSGKI